MTSKAKAEAKQAQEKATKETQDLMEVYDYCMQDSIQQSNLQQKLKLIQQVILQSNLTKLELSKCVFNSNQIKVDAIIQDIYQSEKKPYNNEIDIYKKQYQPSDKQRAQLLEKREVLEVQDIQEESNSSDPDPDPDPIEETYEQTYEQTYDFNQKKWIINIGGEVLLNCPGFHKYVTAIDIASSYPAQKEANNIDKSFMLTQQNMQLYIENKEFFKIKTIKYYKLYDMYSPYITETLAQWEMDVESEIIYLLPYDESPKKYRWQIVFEKEGGTYIFQQFYFEKKNQFVQYSFVFLLQKYQSLEQQFQDNYINTQSGYISPKSLLLTSIRAERNKSKKELANEQKSPQSPQSPKPDKDVIAYLDSRQNTLKLLMNTEYGANDSSSSCNYDVYEPSLVTKCSRYIIQNCRDIIQSDVIYATEEQFGLFDVYNNFVSNNFVKCNNLLVKRKGGQKNMYELDFIKPFYKCSKPKIQVIYQDTDSNYIIMTDLDAATVICPEKEIYIKSTAFGHFNNCFAEYMKRIMNKFPLQFSFEGAFYRSWYIGKKNYLGYKIDAITCDDKLNILQPIEENINLTGYQYEQDITQFIKQKHIKITGLKVIKRNTTFLARKCYLELIQHILNSQGGGETFQTPTTQYDQFQYDQFQYDQFQYDQFIINLINRLKTADLPIENFVEMMRVSRSALDKPYFNNMPVGIGDKVFTYIHQPPDIKTLQFQEITKYIYTSIYKINEEVQTVTRPAYLASYLFNITQNLLKVIDNTIESKQVCDFIQQHQLFTIGNPKDLTLKSTTKSLKVLKEALELANKMDVQDDQLIEVKAYKTTKTVLQTIINKIQGIEGTK